MDKKKLRRFRWAVYLLIGALAIILYFVGFLIAAESPLGNLFLSLAAELLGVALIFFIVNQFFVLPPQEDEQREVLRKVSHLLDEATRMTAVQFLPTPKAIFDWAIATLENDQWEKLRIFAPVGLWRESEGKKRWLQAVAQHAKTGGVKAVWAVFGLPPKTRKGETRPYSQVAEDLKYVREILDVFNDSKNVTLHFYPPFPASVGFGVLVFESTERTGGELVFGLSSHTHEEVVDTGFSVNNKELFFTAREWFDEQIFWKATGKFVLHNVDKSLEERWTDIVETWYGRKYLGKEVETQRPQRRETRAGNSS